MIWTGSCGTRGHRFVRYADDLRVFVRSERAAQRVFESVCGVIERRLKLKVNREKSSIRHAARGDAAGVRVPSSTARRSGSGSPPRRSERLKDQLRILTRRNWGVSMDYRIGRLNRFTTGWMAYFRLADTREPGPRAGQMAAPPPAAGPLEGMEDRPPPGGTTCGYAVSPRATSGNGAAAARDTGGLRAPRSFGVALPNTYWDHLGLKTLTARPGSVSIRRLDEPPDAGPHVRWCGRGRGDPAPYSILRTAQFGNAALERLSA